MTDPSISDQFDYCDDLRQGGWLGIGNDAGGWIGIDDDTLVVVRDGDHFTVPFDEVTEVTARDIDRFIGILSLALVGFGIWATTENVLGGIAFAVTGGVSLYLTYRKRDRITITVAGRPKPIRVYPTNAGTTYGALTDALHKRK
jgi:transketolase C-terminal domain/subunit